MRTVDFNYRSGKQVIPEEISTGILQVIGDLNYSLRRYDIKNFKNDLSDQLRIIGWSGEVVLSTRSRISITSILRNVGLCTQTGNMARMYADLLKLQALYMDEKIKAAIFVIPMKECARSFGDNVACYERLVNELTNIFSKVITVPMVIIGFDNEE